MSETNATVSSLTRLSGTVGAGLLFALGPAAVAHDVPALEWGVGKDVRHPVVLLAGVTESTSAQVTLVKVVFKHEERQPKTQLGERLLALRAQAISKGMLLLNWEEVSDEVRRRRGERLNGE